jgi:hypothetical protein
VLRIVMEELEPGEVAAMYQEGEDALIMVTLDRSVPDVERCAAVNRFLGQLKLQPSPAARPGLRLVGRSAVVVDGGLLPHLSEQVACATG